MGHVIKSVNDHCQFLTVYIKKRQAINWNNDIIQSTHEYAPSYGEK